MLLNYLGKLENHRFALCVHVEHVSSVTFYHLFNRYLPNVMKISATINTDTTINTYDHFIFCSFTVLNELKERWIVVWSDFWQDIIETAIDQCRKHLQACVRANDGHTFCEQTCKQSAFFMCCWFKWLLSIVSDFLLCWCLMDDRPALLNCKALSLLRTVNEQKVKCCYFA